MPKRFSTTTDGSTMRLRKRGVKKAKKLYSPSPLSGAPRRIGAVAKERSQYINRWPRPVKESSMRRYLVLVAVIALSTKATLGQTPALAAGITDQCWTVQELLAFHIPPPWQPPKRRGRSSKVLQSLIKRWRCLTTVKCGATPKDPNTIKGQI